MYISSDTNIWFDFEATGFLEHPFLLDNEYYISDVTYHDEIQFSDTIRRIVESRQLHITSVPVKELQLAAKFAEKYPAISMYDAIALSIAKTRGWTLLSGDRKLKEAAVMESVECHGTLWIYALLKEEKRLSDREYKKALENLLDAVEKKGRRLPRAEIIKMLDEESS